MPAKLIICCSGRPALNGHKRRSFLWSAQYNCFVHEGRVLDEKDFNAVAEAVFKKNQDLRPGVRVVQFSDAAPVLAPDTAARIAELEAKLAAAPADLSARVTELEAQLAAPTADITLEAVLEVVSRLAPHKLKGQPGKKPAAVAVPDEV